MVCEICSKKMEKKERTIKANGNTHHVHIKCLKTTTKEQLVNKKIIKSDDFLWRLL